MKTETQKPELSIIITSYKNPAVLRLCLESLKKNVLCENYDILVVDSATEEATEIMMRENFPEIAFFPHSKNLGFARLANEGLEKSTGDYILILNADIVIEKKSVDLLMEFLKKNPDVGLVGPKLLNFDGSIQPSRFRFYTPLVILYRRTPIGKLKFAQKKIQRFLYEDKDLEKPFEADWLMGSALMATRRSLEKIGLMEENFGFMYFEDVDWCRRFWESGLKVVYYPLVQMYHYHGKGSASAGVVKSVLFNKYTREHLKSGLKYFWKYLGKPNPHKE
ncbi:MAG: glycosyltransferase family 2 protein [Candidatus Moranbacteria bacterium]|nr:glycosyltransferase family 2 protein [Candidatus Moranbacteria bacterium]